MPAARTAAYAEAGARKWNSFGSGVPRVVTAVSRLTTARSAADSTLATGPNAVAGSLSRAAVRPVKCTSPPNARVSSTGAGGDGDAVGGAGPVPPEAPAADGRGAGVAAPQPASSAAVAAATTAR